MLKIVATHLCNVENQPNPCEWVEWCVVEENPKIKSDTFRNDISNYKKCECWKIYLLHYLIHFLFFIHSIYSTFIIPLKYFLLMPRKYCNIERCVWNATHELIASGVGVYLQSADSAVKIKLLGSPVPLSWYRHDRSNVSTILTGRSA